VLGDYVMQCGNMNSCINALFTLKEVELDEDFLANVAGTTKEKQISRVVFGTLT